MFANLWVRGGYATTRSSPARVDGGRCCASFCLAWLALVLVARADPPVLVSLGIDPPGWSGWGLYERIEFRCVPTWSDAVPDPGCTRAGSPPAWSIAGYGRIEGPANTAAITWNSGHGAGTGTLQVVYGGLTKTATVTGVIPDENDPDYRYYNTYPGIQSSESNRWAFMLMTKAQWRAYYAAQTNAALQLSSNLDAYIRGWMAEAEPAALPPGLLPPSIDNDKTRDWTLCDPDDVSPEEQWYWRPANQIPADFSALYFLGPDNHVTYLKCVFLAPFGAKLIIEGEFPHCRFMDFQILSPFDPRNPTTSGLGAPEVPLVDADVDPLPGHVNPFRPGANRNATNRGYRVVFDLEAGNSVELNPQAMIAPAYRAPGNVRVGGPFASAGPDGNGALIASVVWLRYYAPDIGVGPLGGVSLPKCRLELATGEPFWLRCDFSLTAARQNKAVPGFWTIPFNPPEYLGPTLGWLKMFGIWLIFAEGQAYPFAEPWTGVPREDLAAPIRNADRLVYGRGSEMAPPGNYEASASICNYNSYLVRPISLGFGNVIVLTGALPSTPQTLNGNAVMTSAEARYVSFTHTGNGKDGMYTSLLYGSLMDEEIVLDAQRRYVIVYSYRLQRPSNAIATAGVTWQSWGLEALQVLNMRWLSVMPEWHLPAYAPHEDRIPWETGDWAQSLYDPYLVGRNCQGILGPYQPIIHYMTKAQFEALGKPVTPDEIPWWPSPPRITSVDFLGNGEVGLAWQAVQQVWVQFSGDPLTQPPSWTNIAGPIGGTNWTGQVPGGAGKGYIRLVGPCPACQ